MFNPLILYVLLSDICGIYSILFETSGRYIIYYPLFSFENVTLFTHNKAKQSSQGSVCSRLVNGARDKKREFCKHTHANNHNLKRIHKILERKYIRNFNYSFVIENIAGISLHQFSAWQELRNHWDNSCSMTSKWTSFTCTILAKVELYTVVGLAGHCCYFKNLTSDSDFNFGKIDLTWASISFLDLYMLLFSVSDIQCLRDASDSTHTGANLCLCSIAVFLLWNYLFETWLFPFFETRNNDKILTECILCISTIIHDIFLTLICTVPQYYFSQIYSSSIKSLCSRTNTSRKLVAAIACLVKSCHVPKL